MIFVDGEAGEPCCKRMLDNLKGESATRIVFLPFEEKTLASLEMGYGYEFATIIWFCPWCGEKIQVK